MQTSPVSKSRLKEMILVTTGFFSFHSDRQGSHQWHADPMGSEITLALGPTAKGKVTIDFLVAQVKEPDGPSRLSPESIDLVSRSL